MSRIQDHLAGYAARLEADFARVRHTLSDSGIKGNLNERTLFEFLQNHVPATFFATRAQIFDSRDVISDELDIVACNEYQPFRDRHGGLFIVEGVDFVVQVKAILSTNELGRVFANCRSAKALERKWSGGDQVFVGNKAVREKVPYVCFAYTSELTDTTLRERLEELSAEVPLLDQPDAFFVLDRGLSLLNAHDGTSLGWAQDGRRVLGWMMWKTGTHTLFELLRFLSLEIPKFVRVRPPIWSYFPPLVNYPGVGRLADPGEVQSSPRAT